MIPRLCKYLVIISKQSLIMCLNIIYYGFYTLTLLLSVCLSFTEFVLHLTKAFSVLLLSSHEIWNGNLTCMIDFSLNGFKALMWKPSCVSQSILHESQIHTSIWMTLFETKVFDEKWSDAEKSLKHMLEQNDSKQIKQKRSKT